MLPDIVHLPRSNYDTWAPKSGEDPADFFKSKIDNIENTSEMVPGRDHATGVAGDNLSHSLRNDTVSQTKLFCVLSFAKWKLYAFKLFTLDCFLWIFLCKAAM